MTMTPHDWSILGMYGILLVMGGALYLYVTLGISRSRRRKHAR